MNREKLVKMWVMPETIKNVKLKQDRIKADLGIKVPQSRILYALSRQPLIEDRAGVDFRKMARKRSKNFLQ